MCFKVIHQSRILATKSEFSFNELLGQSIVVTSLTHNLDGTNFSEGKSWYEAQFIEFLRPQ